MCRGCAVSRMLCLLVHVLTKPVLFPFLLFGSTSWRALHKLLWGQRGGILVRNSWKRRTTRATSLSCDWYIYLCTCWQALFSFLLFFYSTTPFHWRTLSYDTGYVFIVDRGCTWDILLLWMASHFVHVLTKLLFIPTFSMQMLVVEPCETVFGLPGMWSLFTFRAHPLVCERRLCELSFARLCSNPFFSLSIHVLRRICSCLATLSCVSRLVYLCSGDIVGAGFCVSLQFVISRFASCKTAAGKQRLHPVWRARAQFMEHVSPKKWRTSVEPRQCRLKIIFVPCTSSFSIKEWRPSLSIKMSSSSLTGTRNSSPQAWSYRSHMGLRFATAGGGRCVLKVRVRSTSIRSCLFARKVK